MSGKQLFTDFPSISDKAWKEKIARDLKGKDFEETLVWKSQEGFEINPYYRKSDLRPDRQIPGEFPFKRGRKPHDNVWFIKEDFLFTGENHSRAKQINESIAKGTSAIGIKGDFSNADIAEITKEIDLSKTALHFYPNEGKHKHTLENLISELPGKKEKLRGGLNYSPLSFLTSKGSWPEGEHEELDKATEIVRLASEHFSSFPVLEADGSIFRNAGSNITQEIAFTLAMGNEYLVRLSEKGIKTDDITGNMLFTLSTGTSYFLEIAKIKAFRVLWSAIADQYKPAEKRSSAAYIHSITSDWDATIRDPQNNTLRATTEAMAAICGGCDCFTVTPYNFLFEPPTPFSRKLARNVQIILKEEAYLDKVIDPAAGSYYVEQLVEKLSHAAWDLFLEVQGNGGYFQALKTGFIKEKIDAILHKKIQSLRENKSVLVGTNKYVDEEKEVPAPVRKKQAKRNNGEVVEPLPSFHAFELINNTDTVNNG